MEKRFRRINKEFVFSGTRFYVGEIVIIQEDTIIIIATDNTGDEMRKITDLEFYVDSNSEMIDIDLI